MGDLTLTLDHLDHSTMTNAELESRSDSFIDYRYIAANHRRENIAMKSSDYHDGFIKTFLDPAQDAFSDANRLAVESAGIVLEEERQRRNTRRLPPHKLDINNWFDGHHRRVDPATGKENPPNNGSALFEKKAKNPQNERRVFDLEMMLARVLTGALLLFFIATIATLAA